MADSDLFVAFRVRLKKFEPGRCSGLEDREDSFETLAIGPVKAASAARSRISLLTTYYFVRRSRWAGNAVGAISFFFVRLMLYLPFNPMPEWSKRCSLPLCALWLLISEFVRACASFLACSSQNEPVQERREALAVLTHGQQEAWVSDDVWAQDCGLSDLSERTHPWPSYQPVNVVTVRTEEGELLGIYLKETMLVRANTFQIPSMPGLSRQLNSQSQGR